MSRTLKGKSSNYKSAKAGGWTNKADDLFLARFRGKPCEICGKRGGYDNGKTIRSAGHHLIFKGGCRKHRYEPKNIIVLCPYHHSHYNKECSPHSITNTHAQTTFEKWVQENKPEQYKWWMDHMEDSNKVFDDSWTPRDKYVELGGEILDTNGNGDKLPMSKWKPKNHKTKVDALVAKNEGA